MNLDELTLAQIKEIQRLNLLTSNNDIPVEVGYSYFIRTLSYHCVLTVEKIEGKFIVAKEDTFSWIADSGRFMQAINDGNLNEVEPVKVKVSVNSESIIDIYDWIHKLPREQK